MNHRLHFLTLSASLVAACDIAQHVGSDNDSGTPPPDVAAIHDSGSERDVATASDVPTAPDVSAATDAPIGTDAMTGSDTAANSAVVEVSFVVVGERGLEYMDTTVPALQIAAALFTTAPTSPPPPTPIATSGSCNAYASGAFDATGSGTAVDLGPGAVTVSINGGPEQALSVATTGGTFGPDTYGFTLQPAPPAGTHVHIATQARPGLPAVSEDLVTLDLPYATPTPFAGDTGELFLPYVAGADPTITWTVEPSLGGGDVQFLGVSLGSTPVPYELRCTVRTTAGTMTIPWSMLTMYTPGASPPGGIEGSNAGLSQTIVGSDTQSGISVKWSVASFDDAHWTSTTH